jgi:hypothetical protein
VPLTVLNGTAYFALPMPLKDFPQLLRDHVNENPTTPQIESLGEELITLDLVQSCALQSTWACSEPGIAMREEPLCQHKVICCS